MFIYSIVFIRELTFADRARKQTTLDQASPALDVSSLTLDHALLKSFDAVVRKQLEPTWHTASRKTKALV